MNQRLTIELTDETVKRLERLAAQEGSSIEDLVEAYVAIQAKAGVRPRVANLLEDVFGEYEELYKRLA